MRIVDPFANNWRATNNMEGFIIPYELCGEFEEEVLIAKYRKLRNRSFGQFKRFVEHA